MGTQFREGDKPKNNITIGHGTDDVAPKSLDADTGKTASRSFAQPNPAIEHPEPTPKAHASEEEEKDAIKRNSTLRRKTDEDEGDNTDSE